MWTYLRLKHVRRTRYVVHSADTQKGNPVEEQLWSVTYEVYLARLIVRLVVMLVYVLDARGIAYMI